MRGEGGRGEDVTPRRATRKVAGPVAARRGAVRGRVRRGGRHVAGAGDPHVGRGKRRGPDTTQGSSAEEHRPSASPAAPHAGRVRCLCMRRPRGREARSGAAHNAHALPARTEAAPAWKALYRRGHPSSAGVSGANRCQPWPSSRSRGQAGSSATRQAGGR